MKKFTATIINARGESISDFCMAENRNEAEKMLQRKAWANGWKVVEITYDHTIIAASLAAECAEALIDKYNSIPRDMEHDSVLILSHRSLYAQLKELGFENLIAQAQKPINPRGLPIF